MGCICAKDAVVQEDVDLQKQRVHGPKRRLSASGRFKQVELGNSVNGKEIENSKLNGIVFAKVVSVDERKDKQWMPVEPILRLSNPPKSTEGEQVAAGWPAWLSAVAGEAIKGWIPRRADSFEKLDKIGQGTYSNVYKARDLESGKIVALKKVRFDNLEPESVRFMAREIQVLRRLDHPNVIKLEGLVTSRMSCSLYLVFEYMEHDLAGLAACPGTSFTEPQVKCYLQQLLQGLDHCHTRGVLHRDIKGSNLLIDNGGILKIADFGLASVFHPDQKHPLTSRVVTLWYRPPELLLGATDYGAAVDLWSTGCILAELLAGKPIMPGRTEVEQLHKIFKLCGSPSEEYWKKSKLPHATIFKPKQPYKRCISETFKEFPPAALASLEMLLAIEPADRGTAASALKSEFFTTKPLACEPSSLPKYPPSKEYDAKLRDEEARRQRAAGGKVQGPDATKKVGHISKAIPVPDANAELATSIQKRRLDSHAAKSKSEKFNVKQDDPALGFPMEPPRLADGAAVLVSNANHLDSVANNSTAVTGLTKHKEDARAPPLPSCSSSSSVIVPDLKPQVGLDPQAGDSSNLLTSYRKKTGSKQAERIHFSGPLLHPSSNLDVILGERERQVQQAVRRSRHDKGKTLEIVSSQNAWPSASDERKRVAPPPPTSSSGRWKASRLPSTEEILEVGEPEQGLSSVMENYEKEQEI